MNLTVSTHQSASNRIPPRVRECSSRFKTAKGTTHNAYRIYMASLSPSGRKGMQCMLATACRLLGWHDATAWYPWHRLRYQDVQTVRTKLLDQQYAINSVNLTLSGLKSIARTAFNLEQMDAEKLMRIQAVKQVKGAVLSKGRSLAASDIRAVNTAFSTAENRVKACRDKALFLLGCTAGLRSAELIALSVQDIDVKKGVIRVLHAKGRKQREIHLCKPTVQALRQWLMTLGDVRGALFRQVLKNGQITSHSLSKTGLDHILTQIYQTSGIARFSPHDLRRTFITQLLRQGEDINTVRQLAGHASISTTVIYDCRDNDRCQRASRQLRF